MKDGVVLLVSLTLTAEGSVTLSFHLLFRVKLVPKVPVEVKAHKVLVANLAQLVLLVLLVLL